MRKIIKITTKILLTTSCILLSFLLINLITWIYMGIAAASNDTVVFLGRKYTYYGNQNISENTIENYDCVQPFWSPYVCGFSESLNLTKQKFLGFRFYKEDKNRNFIAYPALFDLSVFKREDYEITHSPYPEKVVTVILESYDDPADGGKKTCVIQDAEKINIIAKFFASQPPENADENHQHEVCFYEIVYEDGVAYKYIVDLSDDKRRLLFHDTVLPQDVFEIYQNSFNHK